MHLRSPLFSASGCRQLQTRWAYNGVVSEVRKEIPVKMGERRTLHIVLNALVATAIPNLAWTYLSWRYKLGVGTVYVWPWVFIVTVWYGYRAQRYRWPTRGVSAYDLRWIRVGVFPFLGAVVLPLLNFAINSQAPGKSPAIVIVVSLVLWYLYDFIAIFAKHVLKISQCYSFHSV
jgi:hypothetical protein